MILAKFYQKFLPKCKILVSQAKETVFFYPSPALNLRIKTIHQIARFQLQIGPYTKFSSFWCHTVPLTMLTDMLIAKLAGL